MARRTKRAKPGAAAQSADFFRIAVGAAPNAMIVVDGQGAITLVNQAAERVFGYTREEMIGQKIEMLLPETLRTVHVTFRDDFMRNPSTRSMGAGRELVGQRKDGSEVPVEIGLNPIRAKGGVMVLASIVDITERRRAEAKIAHMALHDALTGLANRVLLNDKLEQALTRVKRGEMVAVHLLDLDHFKNVNDTLGHPAGDKLLKDAACRLRALVRETDTIARMGGDEFAILQVAINQPADATALAAAIRRMIDDPALRRRCIAGGLEVARQHTRDRMYERIRHTLTTAFATAANTPATVDA